MDCLFILHKWRFPFYELILSVVAQRAALADSPKLASHHCTGLFAITALRAGDVSGHYNNILDEKHGGHCAHPSSELTYGKTGKREEASRPCLYSVSHFDT